LNNKVIIGDCREVLKSLPEKSIHCCVTSPPYFGLRSYCAVGSNEKALEIGIEQTPEEYVFNLVEVFREVKRVLQDDGSAWLNLGDSYSGGGRGGDPKHKKDSNSAENTAPSYKGIPAKNLIGIPWQVAFALQKDGWILRSDIIWAKNNPMPESCKDRPTKAHEYISLFAKSQKYYFDNEAIKEPCSESNINDFKKRKTLDNKGTYGNVRADLGRSRVDYMPSNFMRNKRSVWNVNTKPYKGAHFATFPPALIAPCILAGCPENGLVIDPFGGSGTVGEVCNKLGRNYILIELNPEYKTLIDTRVAISI
jgi:DNA modification methylase